MRKKLLTAFAFCFVTAIFLLSLSGWKINQSDQIQETSLAGVEPGLLGESGKLRVFLLMPGSAETVTENENLRAITLLPFSVKKEGRIGRYIVGNWPFENGNIPSAAYAKPAGFIEVTKENINLLVSEHFRLGDFVSKDQPDVWPKYMVLDLKLVDKLELIIAELKREGHEIRHLAVLCGFRSPYCNSSFGDPRGRGKLSRHMYGDAIDIYVDNNLRGWADDLNHDGQVDIHDSEILAAAIERVEARYHKLVGGIGIYPSNGVHGPFVHVDVRGQAARWRG